MTDGVDLGAFDRMQARFRDVRTRLRAWMDEQQTPWKIPCEKCGRDRHLNLDASVNATMQESNFAVRYFACKCWKKEPGKPAAKSTRATHPDP